MRNLGHNLKEKNKAKCISGNTKEYKWKYRNNGLSPLASLRKLSVGPLSLTIQKID